MSFVRYCKKCESHERHIAKEKLGTTEDHCLRCARKEKERRNLNQERGKE